MSHWIFPVLAAAIVAATLYLQSSHPKFPPAAAAINLVTVVLLLALGSGSITEIVAEWRSAKLTLHRAEQAVQEVQVKKEEVERIAADIQATAARLGDLEKNFRRTVGDTVALTMLMRSGTLTFGSRSAAAVQEINRLADRMDAEAYPDEGERAARRAELLRLMAIPTPTPLVEPTP